jgi:hypothetical protein
VGEVAEKFSESPRQERVEAEKNLSLVRQISWEEVEPALLLE